MTDAQLAALITAIVGAITALGGVIRWAVNRLATSWDESSKRNVDAQDRGSNALIANTAESARLGAKLDSFTNDLRYALDRLDSLGQFVEENSGVHDNPPKKPERPARPQTPGLGSPTAYMHGRNKDGR